MAQNNYQELEHQTGLILTPTCRIPQSSLLLEDEKCENTRTTTTRTPIKNNASIEALRALRDSNPSLSAKLKFKAAELQMDDNDDDDHDTCMEYWNSIQEVVTFHEDNHSLKSLNVGGLMVRMKTMCPFIGVLKKSHMIQYLKVLNLGGTDIFLSNLLQALEIPEIPENGEEKHENDDETMMMTKMHLEKLYISGCGISCQRNGIDTLQTILRNIPNLTTLDLRYNDLEKSSPRRQNNHHGDEADINKSLKDLFCNYLPQSNIQVLHLEGNNLGRGNDDDDVIAALGNALSQPDIQIRELYLGSNKIQANGAKYIANGLKLNHTVEKIYLEGNFIGDEGVEHFCTLLEGKKQTKKKVIQEEEEEEEEGGNDHCTEEENLNVLEKLWVENNGVGKDLMKRLGTALQK